LDSDARSGTRRKYGWNAMCEQRGIPKAPQGFLSNAQVSYCKKQVGTTSEDVAGVLGRWRAGQDDPRVECLFRPFGATGRAHREQVAGVLEDYPDSAGSLFQIALTGAARRNFTNQQEQP